ncbi:MAG: hypothetical protein J7L15_05735 [Clostridiales bacterium]|nr:hypothetical protein [Clostridiales bacterium]
MRFKYDVGDEVVITTEARTNSILKNTPWEDLTPRRINQRFIDSSVDKLRYRIDGLWFNEDEIERTSKEQTPEYYL